MFGMKSVAFSARRGVSRTGAAAALALWVLLSLVSGAGQALCLDFGGDCSPSGSSTPASCHEEPGENEFTPGCGSCVDVLVPDDASARSNRPDHDAGTPATPPHPLVAADVASAPSAHAAAFSGAALIRRSPLDPRLRTTVLLI